MRKQKNENSDTIEITEDVRVTGTDIILEAGDKIQVIKEMLTFTAVEEFAREAIDSVARGNKDPRDIGASIGENLSEELHDAMEKFDMANDYRENFIKGFKDAIRKEL